MRTTPTKAYFNKYQTKTKGTTHRVVINRGIGDTNLFKLSVPKGGKAMGSRNHKEI